MSIDQAEFRQALGHFATGVTVVTTGQDGALQAATVSAFSSLSLEPPLVLVCLHNEWGGLPLLKAAGGFAVNILAADGERLSRHFAARSDDKFAGIAYHLAGNGAPLLDEALATLECRVHKLLPGGDHTIIVGEVVAMQVNTGQPLLYYRGGYGAFQA